MDRDQSQLRSSCSLSVLNQRQLTVVRSSKSSDNLHRVSLPLSPPSSRKSSIFSLRKSRKSEKSRKNDKNERCENSQRQSQDRNKPKNVIPGAETSTANGEEMAFSWHSNLSSSRKSRKSEKSRKNDKNERCENSQRQSQDRNKPKNVIPGAETSTANGEEMAFSWHSNLSSSRAEYYWLVEQNNMLAEWKADMDKGYERFWVHDNNTNSALNENIRRCRVVVIFVSTIPKGGTRIT
ncbi:hypothetical protein Tcan_04048 [Toxocara canis]|uniref:Uncharacterized protein n=1 Tax=Toxocara canis TaxID=6265 RepID=A0A0B2W4R2_TOXCA|nr:hypothetical protein Tcan_04048 [Toxocara canis]